MNNKKIVAGFLSASVFSAVFLTSTVSAFWPFDSMFKKGIVKAITTDMENSTSRQKPVKGPGGIMPSGTIPQMTVVNAITAMNGICEKLELSNTMKVGNQQRRSETAETTETTETTKTALTEKKVVAMDKEIVDIHNKLRAECLNIKKLNARLGKISPYITNKPKDIIMNTEDELVTEKPEVTPVRIDRENIGGFIKPTETETGEVKTRITPRQMIKK